MFIDETEIVVSSGPGGAGVVSFRREKFIPKGGPDGGDGGKGGDVVLLADPSCTTLIGIQHGRNYRAKGGQPGGAANCSGRGAEDLVLPVPVGTLVRDADRGHVLRDLSEAGERVVIVAGGRGGRGNKHFANSTNRTPRQSTPGGPGETRRVKLELRLVADVGLVGLPNAGKSTFLRRVSAARPKVAEYPFTTLAPVLGIVEGDEDGLVIADIPGLIEGAHLGAGLGDRFLRHVARTRVLLHLIDGTAGSEGVVSAWRVIRAELAASTLGLAQKPELLAVTKLDAVSESQEVLEALSRVAGPDVVGLSAVTGQGVPEVLGRLRYLAALAVEAGKDEARPPSKPAAPIAPDLPPRHPGSSPA